MRGGWVTQLSTFAYVVVWPEILYEVEYELEAEELRTLQEDASKSKKEKEKEKEQKQKEREQQQQQQQSQQSNTEPEHEKGEEKEKDEMQSHQQHQEEQSQRGYQEVTDRDRRFHPPPSSSPEGSSSTVVARGGNAPSPSASSATLDLLSASTFSAAESLGTSGFLPPPGSSSSLTDAASPSHPRSPPHSELPSASASPPTVQTEGERFALAARLSRIADKEAQAAYERSAAFGRKPAPVATSHPSLNTSPHLAHLSPYIIVDARRATGKDSLYLSAIGRRLTDPKVRAAWPVFWKYFNGRAALERVVLGLGGDGADTGAGVGVSGGSSDKMKIKKRKEAWALMAAMSEHLICVRHF
jgi:hypothetical protein